MNAAELKRDSWILQIISLIKPDFSIEMKANHQLFLPFKAASWHRSAPPAAADRGLGRAGRGKDGKPGRQLVARRAGLGQRRRPGRALERLAVVTPSAHNAQKKK